MNDDLAWIRGRMLTLDAEVKRLKERDTDLTRMIGGVRDELIEEIRYLRSELSNWQETTEVKNLRRAELERLRARADEADQADYKIVSIRAKARRNVAILAPAIAALLYALAEIAKAWVHK